MNDIVELRKALKLKDGDPMHGDSVLLHAAQRIRELEAKVESLSAGLEAAKDFDAMVVDDRVRELEDFARFMCKAWAEIDDWAHTRCGGDALMSYPMIQGTGNQMRLRKIGQQEHDAANIAKAVEALGESE